MGPEQEKQNRTEWEGDQASTIPEKLRSPKGPLYVHYRNGNLYRILSEELINPNGERCVCYQPVADASKLYVQRRTRFFAYVGYGKTRTQRFTLAGGITDE